MSGQSEKCKKPEIEILLSDYFTGHLDNNQEEQVRIHLKECKSCRTSLRMMANISGKHIPTEVVVSDEHFSPQLLGRYYTNPTSLDPKLTAEIKEHLKYCKECTADIAFLHESDSDLRMIIQTHKKKSRSNSLWVWFKKLINI